MSAQDGNNKTWRIFFKSGGRLNSERLAPEKSIKRSPSINNAKIDQNFPLGLLSDFPGSASGILEVACGRWNVRSWM